MADAVINVVSVPTFEKSATKPIYMVVADCHTDKAQTFYLTQKVERMAWGLVVKGQKLTEAQAKKAGPDNTLEVEIEVEIPWGRVRRIENLSYKPKAQGEKK